MARRTLAAHSMEFHRKFKRGDRETIAPADLDGADLLSVFEVWCAGLDPYAIRDDEHKVWVRVQSIDRTASRVLLVTLSVGSWGEPGEIISAVDGAKVFDLHEDQAPTGTTRAVLMVPGRGETALFFSEYSSRGSGGSRLMRSFAKHWSAASDTITMQTEAQIESETWASGASLKEVEVRVRGRSADVADPIKDIVGVQSHVIRPKRNHRFPMGVLDDLKRSPMKAGQLVGIPSMPTDSEVYVTLQGQDGRAKKFLLGQDADAPPLREVLNQADEPPLSDEDLVKRCAERASELLDRLGQDWKPEWSR